MLANEGLQMWSMRQVSIEKLLENNSLNELYIGLLNIEAAAVVIVQEEDALLWSEDTKHESLYLHKLCVRRKYANTGLSQEKVNEKVIHGKYPTVFFEYCVD